MLICLAWMVFIIAIATALMALGLILGGREYDQWKAEMDRKGIEWPVQGVSDVAYREVPARKTNR